MKLFPVMKWNAFNPGHQLQIFKLILLLRVVIISDTIIFKERRSFEGLPKYIRALFTRSGRFLIKRHCLFAGRDLKDDPSFVSSFHAAALLNSWELQTKVNNLIALLGKIYSLL